MSDKAKGIWFLLVAGFLYSWMGILVRFLTAENVPQISQVFLRYIIAFLGAFTYFKVTKSKFKFYKKGLGLLIAVSVFGYGLTNLFFNLAMANTQISTGLFIFSLFAIITPILSFVLLKEKANKYNFIGLFISFIALVLLFKPNSMTTWKIGGFFASLAAIGQSLYLIGRKKLSKYSSKQLLVTNTLAGIATLGLMALIFNQNFLFGQQGIKTLSWKAWAGIVVFGLDNFLAWLFMTKGFQLVKASLGSLILLLENVMVIALGLLVLKEVPTVFALYGGLLVMIASALVAIKGENS